LESLSSEFTALGFAAQPVTLFQLGKLKMVSSLSQENKGYQFERFSTQAQSARRTFSEYSVALLRSSYLLFLQD